MIYLKFTSYLLTIPEGHPEGGRHYGQGQIRTHFPFREISFKSQECSCEAMRSSCYSEIVNKSILQNTIYATDLQA